MSVVFFGLLGLAALLGIAVGAWVGDYYGSDAAGRGMTQAFTALGAAALWLVLSILVLVCGARGAFPGRTRFYAPFLLVAAIAGQVLSFAMLDRLSHGEHPELLLRIFIGVSPWLAIACCLGTLSPDWRGLQTAAAASLALLSIVPFAVWRPVQANRAALRASANRSYEDYQAKLQAIREMPDNTPVEQLLAYTDVPEMFTTDLPEEARARIRKLPGKQAAIEALLAKGSDLVFIQLNTFDLAVTPELCAAARKNLARMAGQWRENSAAPQPPADRLVGPIRYLVHSGCACDPELDLLQHAIGQATESFEKDQFLKRLASLRATHGVE